MNFLNLANRNFLISGVANKKSVATFCTQTLLDQGATVMLMVQSEEHRERALKIFPQLEVFIVDVCNQDQINELTSILKAREIRLNGFLHSLAFANLTQPVPFHETSWTNFAQATQISAFSLMAMSNALKECLVDDASVVTISISDTKASSYGYMGPIKAMLDSIVGYLAKSFSEFSKVRFNAICSGPLKTSASAGIPGYVENYLFAEKLTMRKKGLSTQEVANAVCFLLSDASSGINASGMIIDAGMSYNHFDQEVVQLSTSSQNRGKE